MPRPLRVHIEGALYYVTSRAMAGKLLFHDQQDYAVFLGLLKEYKERFGFKLFSYVLLPDCLHLCLELTNQTTVSAVMHSLNSRYTKYFSKRYGPAEHLFQGRFKSVIVEKSPFLLQLTGYLHILPLRTGVTGDLRTYPWSSFCNYLGLNSSAVLNFQTEVQEVEEQLAREFSGWTYDQYLLSVPDQKWEQVHGLLQQRAVGSPEFLSLIEQRFKAMPSNGVLGVKAGTSINGNEGHRITSDESLSGVKRDADKRLEAAAPVPKGKRSLAVVASVMTLLITATGTIIYSEMTTRSLASSLRRLAQVSVWDPAIFNRPVQIAQAATGGFSSAAAAPAIQRASFVAPSALEGTWDLQMRAMYASSDATLKTDQLRFDANTVASAQFTSRGFSGSNYTLTAQPDGTFRWETMQRGPNNEMIFWRGESDGRVMRGVLTHRVPGSGTRDFSFVGTLNSPGNNPQGTEKRETTT